MGGMTGLFAVTFAVLVFCMNPSKVNFDQEKNRSHLILCLENNNKTKNAIFLSKLIQVEKKTKTKEYIYWKCSGQYDIEMVQCMTCEVRLHHRYIDQHIVKQEFHF